ncbi:AIP3-domain-containing protein [Annulohypoxylon maeteangense]|uniref:AIP3-domain-containing protein n=1 Tax=Annulohypoxylon maeteangense TaxID=1927788 RepID=UPI0020079A90|nr:AIP3-domain-containing protein [Annulohypoxylon maeteangense]KAI0882577.1 AIP3-domain-containing protein [Annulohypoxylon maeteangense]
MQAPNPSQRSLQRRSPAPNDGASSNIPTRSMSPATMQPRSSTASSRSAGSNSRRNQSNGSSMPLSQIEKSVTHLLVATKQLLETLTQWSRGQATDTQVSDVYVRLGYEFNMACRAFTAINVDTSDLGNVPENLRHILEATLSQEANTESLEKYLPRIRDIIIHLLHGLKRKQQKLRQKQTRDKDGGSSPESSTGIANRTMSSSTTGSNNTGLTSLLNEGLENGYAAPSQQNEGPLGINHSPNRRVLPRDQSNASFNSEQSSLSSNTMQNMPVLAPYPGDESTIPTGPAANLDIDSFPPPPPPPKSQQSALAALQRGGDLERRASRRYSAYQISKHLGAPTNGVPMLPTQNTPIPNRGRGEVRESMRAVQVRESLRHNRNTSNQSKNGYEPSSPVRVPIKIIEESPKPDLLPPRQDSPPARSPDDKYKPSATISGPLDDGFPILAPPGSPEKSRPTIEIDAATELKPRPETPPEKQKQPVQDQSPPLERELTLFLQYKSKVKKFVLPQGYTDLTIGRLQLAFIEKFSWNTALNGSDLPEIYIQDPVSGIRHELEDLSDIKDRTVLALNVEPLDEVKKHFDEGIGALKKAVDEVKQNVTDQGSALQRVSDRQLETAKEMARMAAAPPPMMDGVKAGGAGAGAKLNPNQLRELQSLRRDLAVLRQTYSNFQTEIQSSMSSLRGKAANVKVAAAKASVPAGQGDAGYAYVTKGRKQLNSDSDRLVTRVDDLQDLVEDLRKDVVNRGVRPLPRQLEGVSKDIQVLTKELKKVQEYMKREKPVWTKIWEKELEEVCQGRDELKVMEDLMVDLQDDIEKASETFALVEQATKEQMKDTAPTGRQFSKGLHHLGNSSDPSAAKEGVLGEVRALQPNHEDRLEAIERAEKLRQKELESRRDNPLTKELTKFVEDGKLKKSGGFEEVERARKAKDDRIRREVWERMNGIIPDEPVGEEGNNEEEAEVAAETPDVEGGDGI